MRRFAWAACLIAVAVLGCSSGPTTLKSVAQGHWACSVEGDRLDSFESRAEALDDGYFDRFGLDISFDSDRAGSFVFAIGNGLWAGKYPGSWTLNGTNLSVSFARRSSHEGGRFKARYRYAGVSAKTKTITYKPQFDVESGKVSIKRSGSNITVSWNGWDGGSSATPWKATCRR